MDFLKSAVASAISKGPPFPYHFGDRITVDQSIWTLYNGTKREDNSECSIFAFDVLAERSRLPLARNAVRKMRTLRHPGVIKVFDTVETDSYIYVATERVEPLMWSAKRKSLSAEISKWGLFTIANTLSFINDEAMSIHGCLKLTSVFKSQSGEWRLGGFDVLSSMKEDDAIIYTYGSVVPESGRYSPPEVAKSGWDIIRRHPVSAVDSYGFGLLIFELFNGCIIGNEQIGQTKNIPPEMHQSYKRLLAATPKARLSVADFRDQGRQSGGFFETPLIKLSEGIESLGLKSEGEREEFFRKLDEVADDFPQEFFNVKVLPELLKSVEFGGGGPKAFASVMKIGAKISDEEYNSRITPVITRLFANQDRGIRVCLLQNLPDMIDHLPQKIVNDKIFPHMATGFTDIAPLLREQTVKAVLTIVTKLSDRIINGELLKCLAKTSNDEQPGIRTNTTICLGKIARNLGANTRQKVLAAAFARSLRDPFVHARNAGLLALAATSDLFNDEDCAHKILPGLCSSLIDKEKLVRDQANKTFDIYLQRTRRYGNSLPESVLPPPSNATPSVAASRVGSSQNENSWSGWAISSFTNKLASVSGDMQSKLPSAQAQAHSTEGRLSSAPAAALDTFQPVMTSASTLHRQVLGRTSSTRPVLTHTSTDQFFGDAQDEDDAIDDAWGDMGEDSFFDAPFEQKPATPPDASFDDGGEPDFEGWLQAQVRAKSKAPLPKGLANPLSIQNPPGRPAKASARNTTTGVIGSGAAAKKLASTTVRSKVNNSKSISTKPKEGTADDDWGDAWE